MTVIERYLIAVKMFLPRAAQRDIIDELSEDIRSRTDDRETELGRPLTTAEQEQIVKELGHPALLAGRYGPRRQLISAEVFPFYWLVLRLALSVGVAVHALTAIVMMVQGKAGEALHAALRIPSTAFLQFGVITIVFALLDRSGVLARAGQTWDVRMLPAPPPSPSRVPPVVEIALAAVFWVYWFSALRTPFLLFGPGAAGVAFAPIWQALYVPMLLLALADLARRIFELVRPQSARGRLVARLIVGAMALGVLAMLVRAGEWLVLTDAPRTAANLRTLHMVNQAFPWVFVIAGITVIVSMVVQFRLLRGAVKAAA